MEIAFAKVNRLLRLVFGLGLVSCIAIAGLAVGLPIRVGDMATGSNATASAKVFKGVVARPKVQLADFGASLERPLQRPLEDAPPQAPVTPVQVPAVQPLRLDLVLVGTAIDSDPAHNKAWLQAPGKQSRLVSMGESLPEIDGSPRVIEISQGATVIEVGSQRVTLRMKGKEP